MRSRQPALSEAIGRWRQCTVTARRVAPSRESVEKKRSTVYSSLASRQSPHGRAHRGPNSLWRKSITVVSCHLMSS